MSAENQAPSSTDAPVKPGAGVPDASSGPASRASEPSALRALDSSDQAARDLSDVNAVELISTVAVHMLSAAALRCGLAEDGDEHKDLDEARTIINALAGLITAAAPDLGDTHARALRDGLRSVQLAFREASVIPDKPGEGPGEKYTGAVG